MEPPSEDVNHLFPDLHLDKSQVVHAPPPLHMFNFLTERDFKSIERVRDVDDRPTR